MWARFALGRVLERQSRYADALPHLRLAAVMSGDAEHEAGVLRVERRLAETVGIPRRTWPEPQGRVRISAPSSVTSRVCSNCALRRLSLVTTVQPSSHMSHSCVPRQSIGSMVNVMPGSITVS